MSDRKRKGKWYVIRHSWLTVQQGHHEDSGDENRDDVYPDGLAWHLCENYCSQNVARDLAATCEDPSGCSACSSHEAKFIGRFDTLEEVLEGPHANAINLHQRYTEKGTPYDEQDVVITKLEDSALIKRIDEMSCTVPGDPHPWKFEDLVFVLVKAARGITENMDVLKASDRSKAISDDLYAIHKALEPFTREA